MSSEQLTVIPEIDPKIKDAVEKGKELLQKIQKVSREELSGYRINRPVGGNTIVVRNFGSSTGHISSQKPW